jgi:hypothetical protein
MGQPGGLPAPPDIRWVIFADATGNLITFSLWLWGGGKRRCLIQGWAWLILLKNAARLNEIRVGGGKRRKPKA